MIQVPEATSRSKANPVTLSLTPVPGATLDSRPLEDGALFAGRYRVVGFLGGGGFGVVYRARDERIGRDVALKILRADRQDEASIRRFRREAALARDVVSKNVTPIFDFGVEAGQPFLVMEHLPAGTLRERIANGPLEVEEAIRIGAGILSGLEALHARGILHRDVKPSNVLFAADGTVRLGDLGLAAPQGEDLTRSLAGDGLMGTAAYLAPERALHGTCSSAGDLFATGVVLFEMLCGERPYSDADSVSAILERCVRSAPPIRERRAEVPRWLATVVTRLLEREPTRRYSSAGAVLRDLDGRRASRRARPLRLLSLGSAVGVIAGLFAGVQHYQGTRFSHLRPTGRETAAGIEAVDRRGRLLWRKPEVDSGLARLTRLARIARGEPLRLVTVLAPARDYRPEAVGVLSVVDAQDGRVLRAIDVRSNGAWFPRMAERFRLLGVEPIDLDRDGIDEVVASFGHATSWPSYSVLWEPVLDRVRLVLVASGHQVFAAARDLDGDGAAELLFAGYNSLLGRYPAMSAVALVPRVGRGPQALAGEGLARTPGQYWAGAQAPRPLWSRLLPRGDITYGGAGLAFDDAARTLRIGYGDRPAVVLRFDGEDPDRSAEVATRAARRGLSYRAFDESLRLAAAEEWLPAIAEAHAAQAAARGLEDPVLVECTERLLGAVLARAGSSSEADRLFERLARESEVPAEIAFTAGEAFHLAGDLTRAVGWYRRGLGPGGAISGGGRWPPFFLEGAVLALGEAGRWQDAAEEIDRFVTTFPTFGSMDLFADFVRARQGLPAGRDLDPITAEHFWDTFRYLALERRWQRRRDPGALLAAARDELAAASETRGAVRVLAAEIAAARGQGDEALAMAREGVAELAIVSRTSTVARGLLPLARERLAALTAASAPPSGTPRQSKGPARDSQSLTSRIRPPRQVTPTASGG